MIIEQENIPFFSIIVPMYNSETFVHKCIRSVLEQSYSNFELILVDDGSKDNTFDICVEYEKKDSRVKVIHKENGGHTSARNVGLKFSKGRYILFLDSDDWYDLKVLERCQKNIQSFNVDIIIFNIKSTANEKIISYIQSGSYEVLDESNTILSSSIMAKNGGFVFPKSLSGKCFKREIIVKNQLSMPKEVLIGEDGAAFIGTLFDAKKVSVAEFTGYYCSSRPDSVSHSADEKAFERLYFLFEYYKNKIEEKNFDVWDQFDRFIVAELYTALVFTLRADKDYEYINKCFDKAIKPNYVFNALKKAKFSMKGYKFLIKKFILQNRLWWLAKILDRK